MNQQAESAQSGRLASLDALRGFDMVWIMGADELFHVLAKVSDNSFLAFMAQQTDHVEWNGFTGYDLIFPLFLFIAGVATPYSVGRELSKGTPRNKLIWRVVRRGFLLALLGFIYNNGLAINPLEKLRFGSVLGRIGMAYMFANIIYLYFKPRAQAIWAASLLVGYWLLMKFTSAPGFPPGDLSMEGNFASYFDRLFMPGSLYLTIHDPEGLLSTLPAIGTGILGILTGQFLKNGNPGPKQKAIYLFGAGALFVLIAQIWNLDFPINKNLWTSSFAMQAAGCSLMLLSVFYYVIDVLGYQKWAFFFKVIGMNSILIYMSSVFIDWEFTAKSLLGWIAQLVGSPYELVIGILSIMAIKWAFLYILYRKKIFLKV